MFYHGFFSVNYFPDNYFPGGSGGSSGDVDSACFTVALEHATFTLKLLDCC
jgi:hypothetical protein